MHAFIKNSSEVSSQQPVPSHRFCGETDTQTNNTELTEKEKECLFMALPSFCLRQAITCEASFYGSFKVKPQSSVIHTQAQQAVDINKKTLFKGTMNSPDMVIRPLGWQLLMTRFSELPPPVASSPSGPECLGAMLTTVGGN